VSTRSAKMPVSSYPGDARQLKPVTRSSSSFVNKQPAKQRSQSLAVDSVPSEGQLSSHVLNKVKYY